MSIRLQAYLRLVRPPNLITAVSDIWAGAALSGWFTLDHHSLWPLILLSISSVLLYAGGVVLNDVCDASLDRIERPERPIPSGMVSKSSATIFGATLLACGIILAAINSLYSGMLAVMIAIACIIYDARAKHMAFWGPLNMGVCRGLNLLLGMSILSLQYFLSAWPALVPVLYIAAVTLISRGEVHGGKRSSIVTAMVFYMVVISAIALVGLFKDQLIITLIFLVLFAAFIFPPLFKAMENLSGKQIGRAVKAGVLGLILMNAAWVAAGAGWSWAVFTALLLPVSIGIARKFAVT